MNDTGSAMTRAEQMNDMQPATVTANGDQCSALFSQQKISAGVSPALEHQRWICASAYRWSHLYEPCVGCFPDLSAEYRKCFVFVSSSYCTPNSRLRTDHERGDRQTTGAKKLGVVNREYLINCPEHRKESSQQRKKETTMVRICTSGARVPLDSPTTTMTRPLQEDTRTKTDVPHSQTGCENETQTPRMEGIVFLSRSHFAICSHATRSLAGCIMGRERETRKPLVMQKRMYHHIQKSRWINPVIITPTQDCFLVFFPLLNSLNGSFMRHLLVDRVGDHPTSSFHHLQSHKMAPTKDTIDLTI